MKVNALEGALVEAFSDRFPSFTTVHQGAQLSVSAGTLCSRGNQELGYWATQCLTENFIMSLCSSFLQNDFEICQSDEWVMRVLVIVTDLFQNGAENVMF